MNVKSKIYNKLLTIKIEEDLLEKFQITAGKRNMSAIMRNFITDFLSNKKENSDYIDEITLWGEELKKKKENGTVDVTTDPAYNIEGIYFDGPADLSENHDRYLYGENT